LKLRERSLAQDRDELLAERPRTRLVNVALQAEQAPRRQLARRDFVRDRPGSTKVADEVLGELASGDVGGLGLSPVRLDAFRGISPIAASGTSSRRSIATRRAWSSCASS
jgi:hypothetical protein